MEKYGFVYLWRDRKHKRYYVGSHWGRTIDSYICSSTWMRNSYKRRPKDFTRKIIKNNILTRKDTFLVEEKYLKMIKDEELGKKYYNLCNKIKGHYSLYPETMKTVGEKISASHKADPNWGKWGKGKTIDEETREKLRKANLGKKSPEVGAKIKALWEDPAYREMQTANKIGKKHSPEHVAKRTDKLKALWQTDEFKEKMKINQKAPWNKGTKGSEACREAAKKAWVTRRANKHLMSQKTY